MSLCPWSHSVSAGLRNKTTHGKYTTFVHLFYPFYYYCPSGNLTSSLVSKGLLISAIMHETIVLTSITFFHHKHVQNADV